jgi:hypothetical protein
VAIGAIESCCCGIFLIKVDIVLFDVDDRLTKEGICLSNDLWVDLESQRLITWCGLSLVVFAFETFINRQADLFKGPPTGTHKTPHTLQTSEKRE